MDNKGFVNGIIPDMSGYISPIELITRQAHEAFVEQIEGDIVAKAVMEYDVKIDRYELEKLLLGDRDSYAKGYRNGVIDSRAAESAHWERTYPTTPKSYTRICSRCKGTAYVIGKYEYPRCPHCGAYMRKENEK